MSNDLMRDYLDGKIHVRSREEIEKAALREAVARAISFIEGLAASFKVLGSAARLTTGQAQAMNRVLSVKHNEPADPRERALRAKQQRGTGPDVPVKERGMVTKYKEKS